MNLSDFRAWTAQLQANLSQNEQVLALIALGSMAEVGRTPDEWSDHDFFVITQAGAQEALRSDLSWLPAPERIVMRIRETAHGLKVLYDDAHLLEFAVFDVDELRVAKVNDYRLLFSTIDLSEILASIVKAPAPSEAHYDGERDLLMVLGLCYVGTGRYARGERLSAHAFVKSFAFYHLLPLLSHWTDSTAKHRLDNLDVFRRFEQVFPALGAHLNQALLLPVPQCALVLLELLESYARQHLPVPPTTAFHTVRQHIQRVIDLTGD